jgi:hypothetical protein
MTSTNTIFKSDNRKELSNLYFKAVAEKEVLRRDLERELYPKDQVLCEYTQVDNLVDRLRDLLGTVVLTVP